MKCYFPKNVMCQVETGAARIDELFILIAAADC